MISGVLCLAAILLPLAAWPSMPQPELARWNVDPEHPTIEFRVAHMLVSKTDITLAGTFNGVAKDRCLLGHSITRCVR